MPSVEQNERGVKAAEPTRKRSSFDLCCEVLIIGFKYNELLSC